MLTLSKPSTSSNNKLLSEMSSSSTKSSLASSSSSSLSSSLLTDMINESSTLNIKTENHPLIQHQQQTANFYAPNNNYLDKYYEAADYQQMLLRQQQQQQQQQMSDDPSMQLGNYLSPSKMAYNPGTVAATSPLNTPGTLLKNNNYIQSNDSLATALSNTNPAEILSPITDGKFLNFFNHLQLIFFLILIFWFIVDNRRQQTSHALNTSTPNIKPKIFDGFNISMANSSANNHDPSIQVKLETRHLWQQFASIGTEMIITKCGRRMFPTIKVSVNGLEPTAKYIFLVDVIPADNNRYKYNNSEWNVTGKAEPHTSGR